MGESSDSVKTSDSIKAVAIYEIIKGGGAIIIALCIWIWHSSLLVFLDDMNDAWSSHFGTLFHTQVVTITQVMRQATQNWQLFSLLSIGYAAIRFIEAYGLWLDKTWAYWLSVLGYGLLIPFELYNLITHPFGWLNLSMLVLNIAVVVIVYRQMQKKGLI